MSPIPKVVWMRKHWQLKENPFPAEAIARLGSSDMRENGLLFNPDVQPDKVAEAIEKFVLGAAYGGQKFGFLWSLGTGLQGDARGFGKSVLLQYLVGHINGDFGMAAFVHGGLDKEDADQNPMCAVLASFDMANARSLNAVFFEAVRYACRFAAASDEKTLTERIRERLAGRLGSSSPDDLMEAVNRIQLELRGRTLGPPVEDFLQLLCGDDPDALKVYMDEVTPGKRTRSGAIFMSTFLLFVKASGIEHVLLCCDQLEDFAATTTTKQKRTIETERFRDYILELQPMGDMLSCVVTMHPRATQAIGDMWRLADLPSYDHDREENRHRVVIMQKLQSASEAETMIRQYLDRSRSVPSVDPLYPLSKGAIEIIFARSDGKPRDILRKANALIDTGAEQNWDIIDTTRAAAFLDSLRAADDDEYWAEAPVATPANRAGMWDE